MISQFIIGSILIVLTVIVHAFALDLLGRTTLRIHPHLQKWRYMPQNAAILTIIVLGIFITITFEIWLWALTLFYLAPESLPDFETALYFSTSTFTTAGYGDVVLDERWRLLGSFESANGMLLFGWSTAFIFEVVLRLYGSKKLNGHS